jgi:hypothetical protein
MIHTKNYKHLLFKFLLPCALAPWILWNEKHRKTTEWLFRWCTRKHRNHTIEIDAKEFFHEVGLYLMFEASLGHKILKTHKYKLFNRNFIGIWHTQSFVPKDSCRKFSYGFQSFIIPDENPPIQRSPPKTLWNKTFHRNYIWIWHAPLLTPSFQRTIVGFFFYRLKSSIIPMKVQQSK